MKLAAILPTTGIPPGAPYGHASPDAWAAPAEVVTRGFHHLAQTAGEGAGAIRAAEDAKKLVQVRMDAAEVRSLVELELAQAQSDLSTERDPDAYQKAYAARKKTIEDGLKDRVKYPETLGVLQARLPGVYAEYDKKAIHRTDTLFLDARKGSLRNTIKNNSLLAAEIPLTTEGDAEFTRLYNENQHAVDMAEPVIGADAAEVLRGHTRASMLDERGRRLSQEDPAQFLLDAKGKRFFGMTPEKRDTYVHQAEARVTAQEKAAQAEFDKWEKTVDHDTELERKAMVDTLDSEAERGILSRDKLESYRVMRIATGEDYRRLSKLLDKPDRPEKSDPAVLERLTLDTYSQTPRIKDTDIKAAVQNGSLSIADGRSLLQHLRSREDFWRSQGVMDANRAESAKTRAQVEAGRRQAQAEQLITAGLTTTSPFEKLDPVSQKAKLLALQELTRRSSMFGGKEDPLDVAEEILPRHMSVLIGENRLAADNLRKILNPALPQTAPELEAMKSRLKPGVYETQKHLILDLGRAEKDEQAMRERLDALKGKAPAKPGAYRQQGQRTSKTPVETGRE